MLIMAMRMMTNLKIIKKVISNLEKKVLLTFY